MFKFMNDKLPVSFKGMFKPLTGQNRTNSLISEKVKKKCYESFPKVSLTKLWNNLNQDIKQKKSFMSFKHIMARLSIYLLYDFKDLYLSVN